MDDLPFMQVQKDFVSMISSLQQLNTDFMYIIFRSRQKLRNFARFARRSPPLSYNNLPKFTGTTLRSTSLPQDYFFILREQLYSTVFLQALKIYSGRTSSYSSIQKSKSRISLRIQRELGFIFWLRREKTHSGECMKEGSYCRRKEKMSKSVIGLNSKGRSMQGLKRVYILGEVQSSSMIQAMRMFSILPSISQAHSFNRSVLASSLAMEEDCSNSSLREICIDEEDSQLLMLTSSSSKSLMLLLEDSQLQLRFDSLYSYSCNLYPSLNQQHPKLPLLPSVWLLDMGSCCPEGGEVGQIGCIAYSLLSRFMLSQRRISGRGFRDCVSQRSKFLKVTSESMERRMRVSAEQLFLTLQAVCPSFCSVLSILEESTCSWSMLSFSCWILRMQSSLHLSIFLSSLLILPSICQSLCTHYISSSLPYLCFASLALSNLYFSWITFSISKKTAGESPSLRDCPLLLGERSDQLLVKHQRGVSWACILQQVSSWLSIYRETLSSLFLNSSITNFRSLDVYSSLWNTYAQDRMGSSTVLVQLSNYQEGEGSRINSLVVLALAPPSIDRCSSGILERTVRLKVTRSLFFLIFKVRSSSLLSPLRYCYLSCCSRSQRSFLRIFLQQTQYLRTTLSV